VLSGLQGKIAIANAKLAYQRYKARFAGDRWQQLKNAGARTQRLLWASTGTKNPTYSDVLYVEELIGTDTVNTMPPETMDAFRNHGRARPTLEDNVDTASEMMAALERHGISIGAVTEKLVQDGVRRFADDFDKLLAAVSHKRSTLLGTRLDTQDIVLSSDVEKSVTAALDSWRGHGNVRRLWAGDAELWTDSDEAKWLGWLAVVDAQQHGLADLTALANITQDKVFSHVLLLGMGGSSLGPEVLAETFGHQKERPELLVLDSTDPAQIRAFESKIDPARTLFIVSSKSGTTLEPNILAQYFLTRVRQAVGDQSVGSRFIAITDPGSKLQALAERDHFRHVAFGLPSIGGRYSVLSDFGMVPAAVMGLDLPRFLAKTQKMVRSCSASAPPADNPGVVLGIALGVLGNSGKDKITIVASPGIADFGAWLEQLLAESTGKHGKGLVPVDAEPLGAPDVYGDDRVFVYLRLAETADAAHDAAVTALERAGHPVVRITVTNRYHIGQEFFRWEFATAVAGSILGINPFDQPDVEASKEKTRELTAAYERTGQLPSETPLFADKGLTVFADERNSRTFKDSKTLTACLAAHFATIRARDYCALLAYVERNNQHRDALQDIRVLIRDRKRIATCLGFGPRFLHSTGQVYKGGPNSGVFIQLTCDDPADLQVPGQKYTFGVVKAAQARGDFAVLAQRGRRALRIHLGPQVTAGLATLKRAVQEALN
jgi:transaldolase / glucose-6-phosphate isomerase